MGNKKLTLEQFREKAMKKHKSRKMVAEIEVENYGKITFKRPKDSQMLTYLNETANSIQTDDAGNVIGQDIVRLLDSSKELVYMSCPFLQDEKLKESLGIKDPLETPVELFGMKETMNIAKCIVEEFEGLQVDKEVDEEIKN